MFIKRHLIRLEYLFYQENYIVIKKNEEYLEIPKWKDICDIPLSGKKKMCQPVHTINCNISKNK